MPTSRWDVSLWDVAKWDEVSDDLTADDVQSTSEVTAATIGQEHALTADNAESGSEITSSALAQHHALLAGDIESASVVGAPNVGQAHALAADDIESASTVTDPSIGQAHELVSSDAEAQSQTTIPALGQGFETETEINPTGIGAVADFRGEEKNRRAQDDRERASKDDLTRIINEAFDGKPEPSPEPTKTPEPVAKALPQPETVERAERQTLPDRAVVQLPRIPGARKGRQPAPAVDALIREQREREQIETELAAYEADQQEIRAAKALNDQEALELLLLVA